MTSSPIDTPNDGALSPASAASGSVSSEPAAVSGGRRSRAFGAGLFRLARNGLFMLTVVLPTSAAAIYYGVLASDLYTSESRFVVRMPQRTQQPSVVGALLQSSGIMRSPDDTFTVHDYMLSRDALRELDRKLQLRNAFGGPTVDGLSRFPWLLGDDSFESLFLYYGKRVSVDFDSASAITVLKASAFSAEKAHAINENLLEMGEALVNQINTRAREDLIKYAAAEVKDAEDKARAAALTLAGFRTDRSVFDPEGQSALQLQLVGKLQDELIATRNQLSQVRTLSPDNPQIDVLDKRTKLIEKDIAAETAKVAGSGNSLSNKASEYQRLALDRDFAGRQLGTALASLESARNEARRKQLYLERIVQPSLPDYAVEPRRLRATAATLVLGLIAWGVLSMVLAGAREHRD
ncbi:MAG: hypothetical protein ABI699_05275 [Caldimonas sp.]